MSVGTTDRQVAVLDLRGWAADARGLAAEAAVEGLLVVIDDATTMSSHEDAYSALLSSPRVSSLICLVVGRADQHDQGPVLVRPSTFANSRRTGMLWVGDPVGVRWRPEDGMARAVPEHLTRTGLDELVAVLQEPDVFEAVLAGLGRLPYATASPGLRLLFAAVDDAELSTVGVQALRTVLDGAAVSGAADSFHDMVADIGAEPGATTVALVPGSEIDVARASAVAALDEADLAVAALASPAALFGRERVGQNAYAHLRRAGAVATTLHERSGRLLRSMDGHLRMGNPHLEAVTALGVPEPTPVNRRDVAGVLRKVLQTRLAQHRSPARLLGEIGHEAAAIEPQGCSKELRRHDELAPVVDEAPKFPAWPLPLAATLPLVLVTCLLAGASAGTGQGVALGLALAVVWFLGGWLLLARRPVEHGEAGWSPTLVRAIGAYGVVALVGAAAGVAAARYAREQAIVLPEHTTWSMPSAAVVAAVSALVGAWPLAVGGWRRRLRLAEWREGVDLTTGLVIGAATRQWLPSTRHRVVAGALVEVSNGLQEVVRGLTASNGALFPVVQPNGRDSPDSRAARTELLDTVVADLLDLSNTAMAPCWPAIEAGVRTPPVVHANAVDLLIERYRQHVRTAGILAPPPFALSTAPRVALATQVWRQAPDAVTALQARPDDDMTQLCRGDDLGEISSSSTSTGLVRVAPLPLRTVLDVDARLWQGVREVHWTEGGAVAGTVRLVAIKPGAIGD